MPNEIVYHEKHFCNPVPNNKVVEYIPSILECANARNKMEEIIREYEEQSDVVFSEYLRSLLESEELVLTDEEIRVLLCITGDDEYVTVDDVRKENEDGL